MSRSEVKVGQIWRRDTPTRVFRVRIQDANRSSVTYQVIQIGNEEIKDAIPMTVTKEMFTSLFVRELK